MSWAVVARISLIRGGRPVRYRSRLSSSLKLVRAAITLKSIVYSLTVPTLWYALQSLTSSATAASLSSAAQK